MPHCIFWSSIRHCITNQLRRTAIRRILDLFLAKQAKSVFEDGCVMEHSDPPPPTESNHPVVVD